MQEKFPPLSFSIIEQIEEIPKTDWDNLFGDIIEGYGFQKTLEDARLKEFSIKYLLGKRAGKLCLIIPFFIMDFSFDTLITGPLHKLIKKIKPFLKLKVIFLGSPCAEEFYFGISKKEDLNLIMDETLEEISRFSKEKKISGFLFNNLAQKNKALIEYLLKKRFIMMEGLPSTIIKIEAKSLQDYIKGLSKNMRKDLRRKLKKSSSIAELTTEVREDARDIDQEIYQLYLNNFNDADVHFEILTPEFFRNISKNMPGVAKFFITRDKEKIVAFNLCLIKNDHFIDKFIGLDPESAHKYHLYFTTICHNIDWCIKNGIRNYQPGTTDYYPKIRLGAKLIPLFLYLRAFNPLLDLFFRIFGRLIEPRRIDSSLKRCPKTF